MKNRHKTIYFTFATIVLVAVALLVFANVPSRLKHRNNTMKNLAGGWEAIENGIEQQVVFDEDGKFSTYGGGYDDTPIHLYDTCEWRWRYRWKGMHNVIIIKNCNRDDKGYRGPTHVLRWNSAIPVAGKDPNDIKNYDLVLDDIDIWLGEEPVRGVYRRIPK